MENAMTIDVEDYFQVSAFAPHIERSSWDALPCRVERNVDRILGLLENQHAHATFFTLGWIAERYPALVKRISAAGHEVASHGYGHLRASEQTPEQFREDVTRSKAILEDLSGVKVRGYRAPSFSIGAANLWALDVLAECGYDYSSSIYPIKHDHYGMPDAPRFACRPSPNGVLEFPVTTVSLLRRNFPAGGGGYFRLAPYTFSRWIMQRVNREDGEPCIFYFHPWEIDPDQPRPSGLTLKTRFRHYVNLARMEARVATLLRDFEWNRLDRVYKIAS